MKYLPQKRPVLVGHGSSATWVLEEFVDKSQQSTSIENTNYLYAHQDSTRMLRKGKKPQHKTA